MTVACWKKGCTRDAPHRMSGDGWALWSCDRHLAVAQAVTGDRPGRSKQGALFEVVDGGAV